jgi:hypothetical protein
MARQSFEGRNPPLRRKRRWTLRGWDGHDQSVEAYEKTIVPKPSVGTKDTATPTLIACEIRGFEWSKPPPTQVWNARYALQSPTTLPNAANAWSSGSKTTSGGRD